MSPTPYHVAVDEATITVRVDRAIFDPDALAKFLDYLSLEAIRRRSQATQAEVDALATEVKRKAWQRVQTQILVETPSA